MPQVALGLYSVYQGVQAGKQADKDRASRDRASAAETQLGLEDRKYYRDKFGPMNQMLVDYAMGNKPSPYLAKAKGHVEAGYQAGMTQLNEIAGHQNLGETGLGTGQKIGLGMERAKINAGLDLQDQAQRYGVAQSLSGMENNSLAGSNTAARGYGAQAGYSASDLARSEGYQGQAFEDAGSSFGSYFEQLGKTGGNWYGVPTKTTTQKTDQAKTVEQGGTKTDSNLDPYVTGR